MDWCACSVCSEPLPFCVMVSSLDCIIYGREARERERERESVMIKWANLLDLPTMYFSSRNAHAPLYPPPLWCSDITYAPWIPYLGACFLHWMGEVIKASVQLCVCVCVCVSYIYSFRYVRMCVCRIYISIFLHRYVHVLLQEGCIRWFHTLLSFSRFITNSVFLSFFLSLHLVHLLMKIEAFYALAGLLQSPSTILDTRTGSWLFLIAIDTLSRSIMPHSLELACRRQR